MSAAMESGSVMANGVEMYWEGRGAGGVPLVVVHGGFGVTTMFGGVLDALATNRRVIAIELQGHGHTPDIDRPFGWETFGDDIAAFVEAMRLSQVDLLGYSLGGGSSLRAVVQHPELFRRLVVISTPYSREGWYPEVRAGMDQMSEAGFEHMRHTPMFDAYAAVAPDVDGFAALMTKTGDLLRQPYDWSADIAAMTVPTMIVFGDSDSVPVSHAAEYYALLGGSQRDAGWDGSLPTANRLTVLPGATHYDIGQSPAMAAVVDAFLGVTTSPTDGARTRARIDRHAAVATALSALGDEELLAMVTDAPVLGTGIGGTRTVMQVGGASVFVKRVPLTDLERLPQHIQSTANVFDLPVGCQYGVGSPSFGVWREVAANELTTDWVVTGRSANFPLLHHWRALEGRASAEPLSDELADADRAAAFWNGSAAVGRRVEMINVSTATVAMFFEHVPTSLTDWLSSEISSGDERANAAVTTIAEQLRTSVLFMNSNDLFHFDAHLDNMIVDDGTLLLADFGLAMSPRFDLSPSEVAFLAETRSHDVSHTITRLIDWLVMRLTDVADWQARDALIAEVAARAASLVGQSMPAAAAALVRRYAPVAVVINAFYRELHLTDRATPFPRAAVLDACSACGIAVP